MLIGIISEHKRIKQIDQCWINLWGFYAAVLFHDEKAMTYFKLLLITSKIFFDNCKAHVTGFLLDFPEQWDQKKVVLSRSRQFGNCPPVLSCLVSLKNKLGNTQTSRLGSNLHLAIFNMFPGEPINKYFLFEFNRPKKVENNNVIVRHNKKI